MAQTIMNDRSTRVLLVAAGSAAAFIGLAFLIYWVYFTNRGAVYDPFLDEGLATLQVLFYVAFVVHMLGSIGAAAALIIWTRVPKYPTLAAVGVTFALLTVCLIYIMTWLHQCGSGVSFPIPGLSFNCD